MKFSYALIRQRPNLNSLKQGIGVKLALNDADSCLCNVAQQLDDNAPLLGCASQPELVLMSVVAQMPEKLSAIPAVSVIRFGKRETSEGWQIVGEALWRNETNRIPARIANVLDSECMNIARAQQLVVLGALLAMRVIREMLRASATCERLLDSVEIVGIGCHGAKSPRPKLSAWLTAFVVTILSSPLFQCLHRFLAGCL